MDKERFLKSGLLEQYVLGLTSPEEDKIVEKHLAKYPELRQELKDMHRIIDQYATDHHIPPAPKFAAKANEPVAQPTPTEAEKNVASRPTIMSLGGCLIILLAVGLSVLAAVLYREWDAAENRYTRTSAEFAQYKKNCEAEHHSLPELSNLSPLAASTAKCTAILSMRDDPNTCAMLYWHPDNNEAYLSIIHLEAPPSGHKYHIWSDIGEDQYHLKLIDHQLDHLQRISLPTDAESLIITLEPADDPEQPTVSQLVAKGDL